MADESTQLQLKPKPQWVKDCEKECDLGEIIGISTIGTVIVGCLGLCAALLVWLLAYAIGASNEDNQSVYAWTGGIIGAAIPLSYATFIATGRYVGAFWYKPLTFPSNVHKQAYVDYNSLCADDQAEVNPAYAALNALECTDPHFAEARGVWHKTLGLVRDNRRVATANSKPLKLVQAEEHLSHLAEASATYKELNRD